MNRYAGNTIRTALLLFVVGAFYFQHHGGLADNGDYTRSMKAFTSGPVGFDTDWPARGTDAWNRRFFNNWLPYWKLDWPRFPKLDHTSTTLLWLPGVAINGLLYSKTVLYLPAVSLLPKILLVVILLLAFRWIQTSDLKRRNVAFLAIGVPLSLLLTNSDYTAYFSTFYQETGSLVFLLLTLAAVLYANHSSRPRLAIALGLAATLLLATAKTSTVYWPLIVVPWLFFLAFKRTPDSASRGSSGLGKTLVRVAWVVACAVVMVMIAATITRAKNSRDNAYNSLFYGALTFSSDPSIHLRALGIEDALPCIGESAYSPEAAAFLEKHRDRLSLATTAGVVLREPLVLWKMLLHAANSMQETRLDYLGRYAADDPRAQGPADGSQGLRVWSCLKSGAFPTGPALLIVLAAFALWFTWGLRGEGFCRDLSILGWIATLGCLAEMSVAILGDGRQELTKHLFLANVLFDIAAIAAVNTVVVRSWIAIGHHRLPSSPTA